jgi:glycerophosphoryl diester phosphodiesterase
MRELILSLVFLCFFSAAASATEACAHRGDNKVAPENTVPAFVSAVEKRAPQIEFDVHLTKDGEMVVIHDNTVDRTTNGKGRVAEMTFEQIRALDAGGWFGAKFAGTKIPTPREVLDAIPHDILCNVHLREAPGIARSVTKLLQEMGRLDHCFLACTTEQAAEAKTAAPNVRICNMSRQVGDRSAYADATIAAGAEFIQLLGATEDLKPLADKLHQHNVKVNFFEAHTEDKIRECIAAGADFILTDDLDLCLRLTRETGSPKP